MNVLYLREKIGEYFDRQDERGELYSRLGLCAYLGLSAAEFAELERQEDYATDIARAMTRIGAQLESDRRWQGSNASKSVFLLKQPFYGGFTDKPRADDEAVQLEVTLRIEGGGGDEALFGPRDGE